MFLMVSHGVDIRVIIFRVSLSIKSTEAISQLQHKLLAGILKFQFADVKLPPMLTLLFDFMEFKLDVSYHQIVVTVGICTTINSDILKRPVPLPVN